jgi:hypothetical protein
MVPDLFIILGMMGGSRHAYVSILMGSRLVYDRRAEGAPDLSIISSDGVPDLLTDFVSVGLLIRLPRDHLSDQQFLTAGTWKSLACKKFIRPTVFPCMSLRHLRCVPVFQTPKTFCDHFGSPLGASDAFQGPTLLGSHCSIN